MSERRAGDQTTYPLRSLWVAGLPRAKERPRLGRDGKGRAVVYSGASTVAQEDLIGWQWASRYQGEEPQAGDFVLTAVFVGSAGDLDNLLKLAGDALNGVNGAYLDDRQIMEIHAWKLPAGCGVERGTYLALRRKRTGWRAPLVRWLQRRLTPVSAARAGAGGGRAGVAAVSAASTDG